MRRNEINISIVMIVLLLLLFFFLCTFQTKVFKIVDAKASMKIHIPENFFSYFNTSLVIVDFGKLKIKNTYKNYTISVRTNLKTVIFGNHNPEFDTIVVIYHQNRSSDTSIWVKNCFLKGIYPGFGEDLKIFNAYSPSKNDIYWHTNDTALIFYHKTQNTPVYLFLYSRNETTVEVGINGNLYKTVEVPPYKETLLVIPEERLKTYNLIDVKVSKLGSEVGIYVEH